MRQQTAATERPPRTVKLVNAQTESLFGYYREELLGRHVSILAPPECKDEIDVLLAGLGHGERIDHYETLRVTSTGILLDVDVLLWPVRDRDGKIVGAVASTWGTKSTNTGKTVWFALAVEQGGEQAGDPP